MTPRVTGPHVQVLAADRFRLLRPYVYRWEVEDGTHHRMATPARGECDYASVPRVLHVFVGRLDLGLIAPLYHDWIYHYGGRLPQGSHDILVGDLWTASTAPWSRHDADRLFGRHMREEGIVKWRRRAAYRAVRLFGSHAWGNAGSTPPPGFEGTP